MDTYDVTTLGLISRLQLVDAAPRMLLVDNDVRDFLRYRISLAFKLRDLGIDVHVALPEEEGVDDIKRQGIPVHMFYIKRTSTQPLDEFRTWVSLLLVYRQLRPIVVHHFGLKPLLYGGIAARISGVPAVVSTFTGLGWLFTAQSMKTRVLRVLVGMALRFSFRHHNHFAIFQSSGDRDRLVEGTIVRYCHAVIINGSGVDLSLFKPEPEPDGPPVVLMAARLLWQKGVGEFVAAARTLRIRGVRARFVLVGEPDYGHPSAVPIDKLRQWCAAGDVEWLGWRNDIAAVIAQSHIVCLPSYYGEGIPRILVEAAAGGRPIIGTEFCGCREIVRDGENGLIVPPHDTRALVGAISQLIENAPLRTAMGIRGHEIAVAEFSLNSVINSNLGVYHSLLCTLDGVQSRVRVL